MQLSAIELRHLRYFVAVAEAGTLRAAALELHVSQPPLTRQIHQLEELLDCTLFERRPRGMELTSAGEIFYNEAKNMLNLLEQAAQRTQQVHRGQLGRLDVGIFGSAIYGAIPTIIREFRQRYPGVEVVLHNLDRASQIKALRERRLTVGFNRFFGDESDLHWEKVHSEGLNIAMPSEHALAGQAVISLQQIHRDALILYPRNVRPSFIDYVQKLFNDSGMTPNISYEVDDVNTALALVSTGMGLSLVTQSACNLRLPNVTYIPLKGHVDQGFNLDIIYRNDDNSPLLNAFLETVRSLRRHITEVVNNDESARG